MNRKNTSLLIAPPLLVAQGTSTVHYYLYEYQDEEGNPEASIIEIHSETVEYPPDPEYVEVTQEQLHQRGYFTAAEGLQITPPDYVDYRNMGGERIARSWIALKWDYPRIKSQCGSQTISPFDEYIKVTATWEKWLGETMKSKRGPRSAADGNGGEVHRYWNGGHNPFITQPPTYFEHRQYGSHQWRRDDENPIRVQTQRIRKEPPPHE